MQNPEEGNGFVMMVREGLGIKEEWFPEANLARPLSIPLPVLEHVRKPWMVADEIFRVPLWRICVLKLSFLKVMHEEGDYFRFTDKGIRSLFDSNRFEEFFMQVGSGGRSFFSLFLLEDFQQFFTTKYLKVFWRIPARHFLFG